MQLEVYHTQHTKPITLSGPPLQLSTSSAPRHPKAQSGISHSIRTGQNNTTYTVNVIDVHLSVPPHPPSHPSCPSSDVVQWLRLRPNIDPSVPVYCVPPPQISILNQPRPVQTDSNQLPAPEETRLALPAMVDSTHHWLCKL